MFYFVWRQVYVGSGGKYMKFGHPTRWSMKVVDTNITTPFYINVSEDAMAHIEGKKGLERVRVVTKNANDTLHHMHSVPNTVLVYAPMH